MTPPSALLEVCNGGERDLRLIVFGLCDLRGGCGLGGGKGGGGGVIKRATRTEGGRRTSG
jgi:hypothetical protein